jgi:hypothetical protein
MSADSVLKSCANKIVDGPFVNVVVAKLRILRRNLIPDCLLYVIGLLSE